MSRVVPLLALLAGVAAGACSGPSGNRAAMPPPSSSDARASAPAASTAPLAGGTSQVFGAGPGMPATLPAVVARVNGEEISRIELEETVQGIEASVGEAVPSEERGRVYRDVLDELIAQRLLIQEAMRRVTVSSADLDAYVEEIQRQFPSADLFQQMLREQGLTLAALRANLRIELAVALLLEEEIGERMQPSADDISAYYRENREQFRHARVRASHILFAVPPYADASARLRARQQAEAAVAQIRGGQNFAAIAREQSQDPGSAASGGDLGYFEWGDMIEPLNDAVFRLEPNTEIEIVESERGAHVIRVTDRQPASQFAPLDEVRGQIEALLVTVNRQRETAALVAALRARGQVQIYF